MKILLTATEPVVEGAKWAFGGVNLYNDILIVALVIVMITLLISAIVVHRAMKAILRMAAPNAMKGEGVSQAHATTKGKNSIWMWLMGLRPIEDEKDLMMDHEFDGIHELDNPVPVWFNALFYGTIFFGICYLLFYQVFGWGLNQDQEYVAEMEQAEIAKKEFLAKSSNQIDENTVVFDANMAPAGKALFAANCSVCHGNNGEGTIGPNLTDRFWLHGGEIKDVFRTVKYGVPEKGMVPWEQTLTPAQIAEVSSYILTLRDTKPANGKVAEGVEVVVYESEMSNAEGAASDTTAVN